MFDGCIELERERQKAYAELKDEEKYNIKNPKPEVYVFGDNLADILSPGIMFGRQMLQHSHPFAPAEVNLVRYLKGMFTSLDPKQTKEWISGLLRRDIPVGSIDALATYEEMRK